MSQLRRHSEIDVSHLRTAFNVDAPLFVSTSLDYIDILNLKVERVDATFSCVNMRVPRAVPRGFCWKLTVCDSGGTHVFNAHHSVVLGHPWGRVLPLCM